MSSTIHPAPFALAADGTVLVHVARFEACHFSRLPDKPVQQVAFLVDDVEQLILLALVQFGWRSALRYLVESP
jgi:hypothetical protein